MHVPSRGRKWPSSDSQPQGPQSYNQKELNVANTLSELGSGLFLRASRKEHSAADFLISALYGSEHRPGF